MPVASLNTIPTGIQSGDATGRRAAPTKADLAVFANPSSPSPDSAAQPRADSTLQDQGRKLQEADAAMGRPLFLVQKGDYSQTSDLLHHVAGGKKRPTPKTNGTKGAEPPVKPEVVIGPDGKVQPPTPQNTQSEIGRPEPLPQTKPKPDLEVTCEIVRRKCNDKCSKIKPTSKGKMVAQGLCYAGCFAAYSLCRVAGLIASGSQ